MRRTDADAGDGKTYVKGAWYGSKDDRERSGWHRDRFELEGDLLTYRLGDQEVYFHRAG